MIPIKANRFTDFRASPSLLIVSCVQEYLEVLVTKPTRRIQLWWTCDHQWRRWHQRWIGCSLWGHILTQHRHNNPLWLQRACKRKALCTFTFRTLWYFHSTQRKKDIQLRRGDHHQNQFKARNGSLPSLMFFHWSPRRRHARREASYTKRGPPSPDQGAVTAP